MANKFSIKKLAAGVLALLMVVTALPVSGISSTTAKAADETAKVYRSYNPNNGEHLYTVDKSEHDFVVGLGYTDEGERFLVPTSSKTAIYRAYDPNSGEHLLVPKDEAEWLVTQGWNNEGIKMYADDNKTAGVYRVYNPNEKSAGRHNYSNKEEADWLVAQGWKYDNEGQPVFYASEFVDENALTITSAEQTSANTVEVTYSRELTTDDTVKFTRGTSEIAVSTVTNAGKVYTYTFASTLVEDTYKVTVTDKDKKTSEKSFDAEAETLTRINWLSDVLNVSANTTAGMTTATTVVKGEDQWGNEMTLNGASWTTSVGAPSYQATTGKLTLTNPSGFTVGTTVTVICVLQGKGIAESHNYTIGMAGTVSELTLGELTTDNKTYKDAPVVVEDALEKGDYYIPVEAYDENGIELDATDLSNMVTAGTLFITPDTTSTAGVLYVNGFTTKNGKPALKIAAGTTAKPSTGNTPFNLVSDMPVVISVLSTGSAGSTTKDVTIYRSPVITEMEIELPSDLYAGKTSEFKMKAWDQYGNDVDLYTYNLSASTTIGFVDSTSLTVSNAVVTATKDAEKKTIKWEIKPNAGSAGIVSITGTTRGLGSVIVSAAYGADRTIDSVTSLSSSLKTNIVATAPKQKMGDPVLSWSDGVALTSAEMKTQTELTAGAEGKVTPLKGVLQVGTFTTGAANTGIKYAADVSCGSVADNNLTKTNITDAGLAQDAANTNSVYGYAYTLADTTVAKFVTAASGDAAPANNNTKANDLYLKPVAAGSTTLTTHLYKITEAITAADTGTYKVEEINTLKTTITVEAEAEGNYALKFEDAKLYVGQSSAFTDTIGVTLTTKSGAAADQSLLQNMSFVCEDDTMGAQLKLNTSATTPTIGYATTGAPASSWGTGKTAKVTAYATIAVAGGTEQISGTFEVTNVAPKAASIVWYKPAATNTTEAAELLTSHASDTVETSRTYTIPVADIATALRGVYVIDQYGNDITLDGGDAGALSVANIVDAGAGTLPNPTVGWGSTNKSLIKITNGSEALAAGDTFDIVVVHGSQSTTFHITIS